MKQYEQEQAKLKQLGYTVERMKGWGINNRTLYRRAMSIQHRMERIKKTERPKTEKTMKATFQQKDFAGDVVFQMKNVAKSFGERTLFSDVELKVEGGERIALLGDNGTGKSTFINSFSGKAMAKTGNKPGVTRGKQWIRLGGRVELLDTPGLLWPKFDDPKVGENIALIGSINDQILDQGELAVLLIRRLTTVYPGILGARYNIEETGTPVEILESIGEKRGCLKKGGVIDYDRASQILLDEFRSGMLGRITLEKVDDCD
jgi:ribosome biogenesis GTPase A